METISDHDIVLYPPEVFSVLLKHEVNNSRRYGDSLTLIHMAVETEPATVEAQHSAEVFTINVLNIYLRDADIPCKLGNEFYILMPSTGAPGARTACERLKKQMTIETQNFDKVSFTQHTFIGMATMPVDRRMSETELAENAAKALRHAQANHLESVVVFSDIYK